MTRYIHPLSEMVFVTTHHSDGTSSRFRVDGLLGTGQYESSRDVLRSKAEANGGRLDSTADELWRRQRIGRRRFDAAMNRWQRTQIGRGDRAYPHPGNPQDWMPG